MTTDFPKVAPVPIPEDGTIEERREAMEFNIALINYLDKIEERDASDDAHDEEKRRIDLETSRVNLEKAQIGLLSDSNHASLMRGRFFLSGEVTKASISAINTRMLSWHEFAPADQPLTFIINSNGGSVHHGMALFDTIRLIGQERHTVTIANGMALSMGGVLLQAGKERVVSPNAWIMIHEISTGLWGKSGEVRDEAELLDRMEKQIIEIFLERATVSRKQFMKAWSRRDWWIDSKEALKLGIADRIAYS